MVKDSLSATHRFDVKVNCYLLWLVLLTRSGSILFGTFYHPPNSVCSILNSLNHHSLLSIRTKYPNLCCVEISTSFKLID